MFPPNLMNFGAMQRFGGFRGAQPEPSPIAPPRGPYPGTPAGGFGGAPSPGPSPIGPYPVQPIGGPQQPITGPMPIQGGPAYPVQPIQGMPVQGGPAYPAPGLGGMDNIQRLLAMRSMMQAAGMQGGY